MTESELKATLEKLEAQLRQIPGWLNVVYLMAEINKIKTQLADVKILEYSKDQ